MGTLHRSQAREHALHAAEGTAALPGAAQALEGANKALVAGVKAGGEAADAVVAAFLPPAGSSGEGPAACGLQQGMYPHTWRVYMTT